MDVCVLVCVCTYINVCVCFSLNRMDVCTIKCGQWIGYLFLRFCCCSFYVCYVHYYSHRYSVIIQPCMIPIPKQRRRIIVATPPGLTEPITEELFQHTYRSTAVNIISTAVLRGRYSLPEMWLAASCHNRTTGATARVPPLGDYAGRSVSVALAPEDDCITDLDARMPGHPTTEIMLSALGNVCLGKVPPVMSVQLVPRTGHNYRTDFGKSWNRCAALEWIFATHTQQQKETV